MPFLRKKDVPDELIDRIITFASGMDKNEKLKKYWPLIKTYKFKIIQ